MKEREGKRVDPPGGTVELHSDESFPSVGEVEITLDVNRQARRVRVEPRTTLLDALRERLQLTGTKIGCNHGQCGACTVLVEGRRVLSCLTLALSVRGRRITTVEGLADGDALHPVQAAFIKHDGFQCGYCTPGQVCSAVALLEELKAAWPSAATEDVRATLRLDDVIGDAEIRERMSGNLCRCGAYNGIVAAIREALHHSEARVRVASAPDPTEAIE